MAIDVIDIISSAYKTYSVNYQKVLTAFALMAVLSFGAGIVDRFANLANNVSERMCVPPACDPLYAVLIPLAVSLAVSFAVGLVVTVISLAVYKPLGEILSGGAVSDWTKHVSSQVRNTISIYLLSFVQIIALLVPAAAAVAVVFFSGMNGLVLLVAGLIAVVVTFAIVVAFILFLPFVEVELVFSNKGLIDAVKSSYALARANLADVFVFQLLWLIIGIGAGIAVAITCCLAVFTGPIVTYLLLTPIQMLSLLMFWRKLKPAA